MAVDYLVDIVTKATDLASPTIAKLGDSIDRMVGQVSQSSKTAQNAFDPMSNGLAKVTEQSTRAQIAVEKLQDEVRKTGTLTPTVPSGRNDEFERRIKELQALSASISSKILAPQGFTALTKEIGGAQTFRDIDRLGDKIGLLVQKSQMLSSLGGKALKEFGDQIKNATTTAELDRIQASLSGMGQKAQSSIKNLHDLGAKIKEIASQQLGGGFGQGLVGGLIGGAVVQGINMAIHALQEFGHHVVETIKELQELAKHQRQLHIESIETGLSVTALETMRVAAKVSGVEIQQLQFAMKQLAQRVVDQPAVFERAGIAVRNARGEFLPMEDVLKQLMELFKGASSQAEAMALASTLFGRSGTRLLPVLMAGAAGFEAWQAQGQRTGVILDHLADEQLVKLANQLGRAEIAWEGLKNRTAAAVAPVFELTSKAGEAAADHLNRYAVQVLALSEAFEVGRNKVLEWLAAHEQQKQGLEVFLNMLSHVAPAAAAGLKLALIDATESASHLPGMMKAHSNATEEANARLRQMVQELRNNVSEADQFKARVDKLMESIGGADASAAKIDNMALAFSGSRLEVERLAKSFDDGIVKKIAERAPLIQAAAREFGDEWRGVVSVLGSAGEGFANVEKSVDAIGVALKNATEQQKLDILAKNLASDFDRGKVSLLEYTVILDEIKRQVESIGKGGLAKKDILPKPEQFKFEKLPEVQFQAPDVGSLFPPGDQARILDFLAEVQKSARSISDSFQRAFGRMIQGTDQFISHFLDRVFATKTGWGQFWRAIVEEALQQLNRLIISQAFLFLLDLMTGHGSKSVGAASSAIDSVAGAGDAASQLTRAGQAPPEPAVHNTFNISTIDSRSILDQILGPRGDWRRAETRIDELAQAHGG